MLSTLAGSGRTDDANVPTFHERVQRPSPRTASRNNTAYRETWEPSFILSRQKYILRVYATPPLPHHRHLSLARQAEGDTTPSYQTYLTGLV